MKVGSYTIPELRLFPKLYEDVKLIYENYHFDEATDHNAVAKLLKHKSANSGAWLAKLADMRSYGLLEPRTIKVTQLTEKLTHGTDEEKQEATNRTVLNIPLWKELYGRFGVELPESNFWVQLQRITALDSLDAQKYADSVRKAYLDDISHIKTTDKPESGGIKGMGDKINKDVSTIDIQAGPFSQTIPYTAEGIELAKGFLDLLGKQIKTKETKPNSEKN